jgi:hypothetical protein
VDEVPNHEPGPAFATNEGSSAALENFLLNSAACRVAATTLRSGAEVAITFTDVEGDWRICKSPTTGIALERQKAKDPDFELRIPPRAGQAIYSRPDSDVGELGVTFFEHIVEKDPDQKIHVTLRSGLLKLTGRGWLGLLTRGGPTVMMWMAKKGLRGPGAIATALSRLRQ